MAKSPFPSMTAEKAEQIVLIFLGIKYIKSKNYLKSDQMSWGQYPLSRYHHFSNYIDILRLAQELIHPYDFQIPSDQIFHF